MNRYSISPVPITNRRGSDFAGIPYTFEWEENFPYDGEYVFKGACDNKGQLYLDNNKVMDLGGFREMDPKEKKFMKSGVHKIRLDLYNVPIKERIIREVKKLMVDVQQQLNLILRPPQNMQIGLKFLDWILILENHLGVNN